MIKAPAKDETYEFQVHNPYYITTLMTEITF